MKNKKVSIIIVTFNSEKWIKNCLDSIKKQNFNVFEIIIVDNDSKDKTLDILKEYISLKIIKNKQNLGFATANNQGIKLAKGEYILFLNPDVRLSKNCADNLVKKINQNYKIGFVTPKLVKSWNPKIIDSTGVQATKSRRFIERGLESVDSKQYDQESNIFAGSGAALLFRKETLEDIKINNEYFDEDFFCYKEDIDLCWRARLKCWEGIYVPEAIAYHSRGHGLEPLNNFSRLFNRLKIKKSSTFIQIRRWSFRNNIFLILKNDSLKYFIIDLPFILSFWIPALFYYLIFEPYVYLEIPNIIKLTPKMLIKRRLIQKSKKINQKELREYFK
ncbi:MAG: glycosyltransferase family 2 protein [archaeon]